ncbi:MAG: flagellar hook capping protein [Acidocella sp. 20-57-95]|nr:MAG: flagellar hook capping protein [Acidocella sp. 20-57-95]HQT63570.1 flagellar hook capping FlgD N-terminal domain-containing protein [Acidocella sp.]
MSNLAISSSINTASAAASTTAYSNKSGSGSASTLTQSDFLKLLTAQLKYQTPTSPADPTQLASEFAAISTVNGITQLNTQVSNIQASTAAAQMAQASNLVGKQVAVAGNLVTANSNGVAHGAFDLGGPAKSVNVTILSPSGAVAGNVNLGTLSAGQQSFSWNNGTAGSQYSYQVNATSGTGSAVSVTPYSVYTVNGVNVTGSAPTLNVAGSASPIPISSIQTVLGTAP